MSFEIPVKKAINNISGYHLVTEAGYRYEIPVSLYTNYQAYVLRYDLASRWYKQLSDADREKVNKISAY